MNLDRRLRRGRRRNGPESLLGPLVTLYTAIERWVTASAPNERVRDLLATARGHIELAEKVADLRRPEDLLVEAVDLCPLPRRNRYDMMLRVRAAFGRVRMTLDPELKLDADPPATPPEKLDSAA